jgi:hypothetical protein
MAKEILMPAVFLKHGVFWSIALRNIRRFSGRTVSIIIPLFIIMAYASVMTFIKDGMCHDALCSIRARPDAGRDYVGVLTTDELSRVVRHAYDSRAANFQLAWLILLLTVILLAWSQGSSISTEMRKEIGILKALGWRTLDIVEVKMLEIAIIGLSGIFGGMLFGMFYLYMGAPVVKNYFLGLPAAGPAYPMPVCIEWPSVFLLLVIGLFPLFAATLFPAWLMGTIDPDSAMRGG